MSRKPLVVPGSGVSFAGVLAGLLMFPGCGVARAEAQLIQHPDDSSKRVEFFLKKPAGAGPWPAVIFLHGHQEGGRPGERCSSGGKCSIGSQAEDTSPWRSLNRDMGTPTGEAPLRSPNVTAKPECHCEAQRIPH